MTQEPHSSWLPQAEVPDEAPTQEGHDPAVPATGAERPQPGSVTAPTADQLDTTQVPLDEGLWVVGTHGGAAESTVAALLGGRECRHRWPAGPAHAAVAPLVLLTARTNAHGLDAAQAAARTWAAGETPAVRLVGLVLVADSPKRLPKQLSRRADLLGGGVPHVWRLPWAEQARLADLTPDGALPRGFRKPLAEIESVLTDLTGGS